MLVAMVEVGIMRMTVAKTLMPVPVRVRLRHWPVVDMSMVDVVNMAVFVLDRRMGVVMAVPLGEMKPDAERH